MPAPKGNKYAIGNKGGRPPVFKNAKQLGRKVDDYFKYIEGEFHFETQKIKRKNVEIKVWDRYPEPATISGLTLYLGFGHRTSLFDLEKHEEYSYIIARAKSRVELSYEFRLLADKNSQGAQFALKNMTWRDMKSVELTGKDGKAIQSEIIPSNVDYSKLSDDVLKQIADAKKSDVIE